MRPTTAPGPPAGPVSSSPRSTRPIRPTGRTRSSSTGSTVRSIPGYRKITEAAHRYDTPIFAQINHNGGQGSGMYSRLPAWAPSPVADPLFREVPKAVDRHEIREIVDGYAAGGRATAPKAASTGSSCSARTRRSSGASSHRPPTAGPTTTAAPWRTAPACSWRSWRRCASRSVRTWRSASGSAATSSSRAARPLTTPSPWPRRSSGRAWSTTSTPRSGWPRPRST